MANVTFSMTVGAVSGDATISPSDARTTEFLDDLRNGPYLQDPVLSRTAVGQLWLDNLMAGQVAWAKGLRQDALDAAVATADDLLGNS